MFTLTFTFAAFLLACLLTAAGVRVFLLVQPHIGLLDVPNERSSHTRPVPRGGGIALVIVIIGLSILCSVFLNIYIDPIFIAAGSLVAIVSLIDDIRPIPFLPRLVVHFVAAIVVVQHFGGYSDLFNGSWTPIFGGVGATLSVFFIVWMINAYNFMDGIDGILGTQGLIAGSAWGVLGLVTGSSSSALLGFLIAGSCLGFLFLNWHPAKVFMGDVGSTFLGFAVACLPLLSNEKETFDGNYGFILTVCFSTLFLFDTIFTRLKLILTGQKPWLPHREHLYQKLVRHGVTHGTVSLFFLIAGALIAALGILAVRHQVGLAASVAAAAAACLFLLYWSTKKYIDLNIG